MTQPHYDVLIAGNYFCDVIFTGLPSLPALGEEYYAQQLMVVPGGILNTVVALRRLGVRVGWLGALGNDLFSRYIGELAEAEGVDMSLLQRSDESLQRVTVALSYPAERAFVSYVDPSPDTLDMLIERVEALSFSHLHFTGLKVDARMPELLRQCRERGITLSSDCQHRPDTLETPYVREIISALDIFMPNCREAMNLTGTDTLQRAAEILRPLVPTLVIKDGANGAYGWRNGQQFHSPALDLTPVDTTGAGDVFNAGFLTAFLAGEPLPVCLRWGNISGGQSTLGYGGVSTAPTREAVETLLG